MTPLWTRPRPTASFFGAFAFFASHSIAPHEKKTEMLGAGGGKAWAMSCLCVDAVVTDRSTQTHPVPA